jgi:hypothetical protein
MGHDNLLHGGYSDFAFGKKHPIRGAVTVPGFGGRIIETAITAAPCTDAPFYVLPVKRRIYGAILHQSEEHTFLEECAPPPA